MASQNHSLAARQDELTARMGRLTGGGRRGDQVTPGTTDLGFTQAPPDMATNIQRNSGLEAGQIRELWDGGLRGHFTTHNIAPQQLATAGSVNIGNLFATYNQHRDSIDSAPDPLGNLSNLLRDGNPIADLIQGNS